MSIARDWGTTASERALAFPCDRHLASDATYYRGVTVNAPPAVLFRWLCQLRAAPYSYDWIDNLGRRSPQQLTPGLENLHLGQKVMRVWELVEFERDRHITAVTRSRLFGDIAATYMTVPWGAGCRLLLKIVVRFPKGPLGWALSALLPWGDLLMARRQLLNLRTLAERDAKANGTLT